LKIVLLPVGLLAILAVIGVVSRDRESEPQAALAVRLVEVGRFEQPVHVTSPPGDERRLFVVEQGGRIWVVDGHRLPRPFLDISGEVSRTDIEEGLLSLAFAPDYAMSGRFYIDYTDHGHRTIVEEFHRSRDPTLAAVGSRRQVLVVANPTDHHHAGHLLFGPDGYLYISQGDGGDALERNFPSQRLDNLHGKILRIDPRPTGSRPYRIPPDNPFVEGPGRDEIWVYGLRNPWRFGFDAATGALVIGDAGDLSVEELDIAPRAALNFGWNCFEGSAPRAPDGHPSCRNALGPAIEHFRGSTPVVRRNEVAPVVTRGRPRVDARLNPGEPACSIVAGVSVQDPELPTLAGRFLYGDFCDNSIRSFRVAGGRAVERRPLGVEVPLVSSFGVDAANRVYAASLEGPVYRLAAP
jgi:hypothetical protein